MQTNYYRNPIIEFDTSLLYPGEQIALLNPYTNAGYMINPFYYVTTFGRYFSTTSGRFQEKSLSVGYDGYIDLQVSTTAGQKHIKGHRGVLATFNPIPNMYDLQVDHIDGNHINNNLSNLRWVTSAQNNIYASESGIAPTRSRVITDDEICMIMELAGYGLSDPEISERLKPSRIAPETIRMIRTGKTVYGDVIKRLGYEPVMKREHSNATKEEINKILELSDQGYSSAEIEAATGIKARTVRGIVHRASDDYQKPESMRKSNPIIQVPDEFQELNARIVNVNTSPLHTIVPQYAISPDGRMFSMGRGNKWTEMRTGENDKGYTVIGLQTNHGSKQFFVHRLIMATFMPVPNMYDLEVNHINGIHNDNRIENLEWMPHKQNMQHAADNIIQRTPQRAPDEDIIKIVNYAHAGHSDEEISVLMNDEYTPHNIRIIRSGLKTYGPVLEKLHLEPFRYHHGGVAPEDREAIYQFIESRLGSKPLMDLYDDAGAEFGIAPASARKIYGQERAKRS